MRFTVLSTLVALAAFLLLAWLWRGEEAPEEDWKPAPAAVCDVTAASHPTQLLCEFRDGTGGGWTCGAVGDRRP